MYTDIQIFYALICIFYSANVHANNNEITNMILITRILLIRYDRHND